MTISFSSSFLGHWVGTGSRREMNGSMSGSLISDLPYPNISFFTHTYHHSASRGMPYRQRPSSSLCHHHHVDRPHLVYT